MDINRLEKLANLREKGAITEEEFQDAKRQLMDQTEDISYSDNKFGLDDDSFNMLLHLSQFCSS